RRGDAVEVTRLRVLAAAPPAAPTIGTRSLLVILVRWGAETLATTRTAAQAFVFGTDARSTDRWYRDVSYGQLDWNGDVTPVLTIADPGGCDLDVIATAADAAAQGAGYTLADYPNRLVNFPGEHCESRGFGEIGGTYAWVQDGLADLSDGYERLLPAHELGHVLGRYHSHGLECGGVTISAACLGSSSANDEYGNAWDAMGNNWPGDTAGGVAMFGAKHLLELGWFAGRSQAVTTSGTYRLSPIELQSAPHPQALTIATPAHRYYVEVRGPYGQDGFLSGYPQATNGVQVNLRDDLPGGDNGPLNLDFAPGSDDGCLYCDFFDSSLDAGQAYTDLDNAFTLRVDSVAADRTATVTVGFEDLTPPHVVKVPTTSFASLIGTSRVPVVVGWAATDPGGVCRYDLQESVDGGAYAAVPLAAATDTSVERSQRDGTATATGCGPPMRRQRLRLDARPQPGPGRPRPERARHLLLRRLGPAAGDRRLARVAAPRGRPGALGDLAVHRAERRLRRRHRPRPRPRAGLRRRRPRQDGRPARRQPGEPGRRLPAALDRRRHALAEGRGGGRHPRPPEGRRRRLRAPGRLTAPRQGPRGRSGPR
ncbi:MAG TPA: hypothetical protein VFC13_23590, partial [Actinomycetes bacterium]|nr:hypothetical protein [Actinomycetes bacterium]